MPTPPFARAHLWKNSGQDLDMCVSEAPPATELSNLEDRGMIDGKMSGRASVVTLRYGWPQSLHEVGGWRTDDLLQEVNCRLL